MAKEQGLKYDQEKPDLTLVDRKAEEGMVRVLEFGAKKYHRDNWRQGFEWNRLLAAAMRHIRAYTEGEDLDPESGLPHIDHAACMIHFASGHYHHGYGTDDRTRVSAEAV